MKFKNKYYTIICMQMASSVLLHETNFLLLFCTKHLPGSQISTMDKVDLVLTFYVSENIYKGQIWQIK